MPTWFTLAFWRKCSGLTWRAIKQALDFHFKGKAQAVDSNFGTIEAGAEWAAENLKKTDPYYVEPMDATPATSWQMAIPPQRWVRFTAACSSQPGTRSPRPPPWPNRSTSTCPSCARLRTEKHTYAVLQAEDELAAIGMAVGAGWAGLALHDIHIRPGHQPDDRISPGWPTHAEVPIVVWDVQRVGPSTGLPTRTAQGDLTDIYFLGHGDTQYVILLPGSVQECFEFGWKAFDLAERLQTPGLRA